MDTGEGSEENVECPVCSRYFPATSIEVHVNKCIFLNTSEETPAKRKRSESPSLLSKPCSSTNYNNNNATNSKAENNKDQTDVSKTANTNNEPSGFSFVTPLAKQVQPKCLSEFVGQNHVFGQQSVLRTLFEKGEIPNMILWGPPGCGKTSLAGVVNGMCKESPKRLKFVSLCAANAGVKDVHNIVTAAKTELKFGRQTILFMDEIHRFNKRQQDAFLIHVERGDIVLIGATTENPSFSINNALLSRCRVIVFEKLDSEALVDILVRAVHSLHVGLVEDDNPLTYDSSKPITRLSIEKSALGWLADMSDGDARIALTNLQLLLQHNTRNEGLLTEEDMKDAIKAKSHMLYDRKGEEHYNMISAVHKSIRGGDAGAAVYWVARMLSGGEDPMFVARRLVRAASEDVGNADPGALPLAVAAMQGCQLLGAPECDVLLAQCAVYLARAPKSREADAALARARALISQHQGAQPSVPLHLRNAPTKLMRDLGYGTAAHNSCSFMPPELAHIDLFH